MKLNYNNDGLIPVITQDYYTNEVLMLAYMNEESLELTKQTKTATYFSRSRNEIWIKGETSGNTQKVMEMRYDCDSDALLLKVIPNGPACHTNNVSCFYRTLLETDDSFNGNILNELETLLTDRKINPLEKSYTTYLFNKGVDKILKKVAEETGEVIIAAKNDNDELVYEISDLFYHVLVLMVNQGVSLQEIYKELSSRRK